MFKAIISFGLSFASTVFFYTPEEKLKINHEFETCMQSLDNSKVIPSKICILGGKLCGQCSGSTKGFSCTIKFPSGYCVGGCSGESGGCGGTCHYYF